LFNGKPKAGAFWDFHQFDDAVAFGLPLNNEYLPRYRSKQVPKLGNE
jgi:hypothetical protein